MARWLVDEGTATFSNNGGLAHIYQKRPWPLRRKGARNVLQVTVFPSPNTGCHSRMNKAWSPPSELDGKQSFRFTFSGQVTTL